MPAELGYYWPSGAGKGEKVRNLFQAFEAVGFQRCDDGVLKRDLEKVALYADEAGNWTHAARQKDDGSWTSKIGGFEDIQHEGPEHLCGEEYGAIHCYMARPIR